MRALPLLFLVACSPATTQPRRSTEADLEHASPAVQRTVLLADGDVLARPDADHCRIPVPRGATVTASTDETRIAVRSYERLATWTPRTCTSTEHAISQLIGASYIGDTHELLAVADKAAFRVVANAGPSTLIPILPGTPTAWGSSPDARFAVVATWAARKATLSIAALDRDAAPFTIELPIVEREVDGIGFSRDGKTAVVTLPIYSGRRYEERRDPQAHLVIEFDTTTWKSTRKYEVAQTTAPKALRLDGRGKQTTLRWD